MSTIASRLNVPNEVNKGKKPGQGRLRFSSKIMCKFQPCLGELML